MLCSSHTLLFKFLMLFLNPLFHKTCWCFGVFLLNYPHPFSLDFMLDLGNLDLHRIDILVLDQRDGTGLTVIDGLEGHVGQRDVPFAVILLPFSLRRHTY